MANNNTSIPSPIHPDPTAAAAAPTAPVESPAERLARYRSNRFNDAQHQALMPRVRELVLAIPPRDAHEARVMASHVCRFIADMVDAGLGAASNRSADEWLTEETIVRWQGLVAHREELKGGTLTKHMTTLRHAARIAKGLPGRTPRKPVPQRTPVEIDWAPLKALVAGDPDQAAALVAGLGAGITGKGAVGGSVRETHGRVVFVHRDGTEHRLFNNVDDLASAVLEVTVGSSGWTRLLDTAARHGLGVSAQAMRDAWLIDALRTLPCREALALGVDHKRLTAIAAHVPRPSVAKTAGLLRGDAG
jgi:hypothetical protein